MSASALLRLAVCVVAAATLTACGVSDAQPVASEPSDGETGTYSSYADVTYLVECVSDELRNRPELLAARPALEAVGRHLGHRRGNLHHQPV